jgi:CTP synthase (UTP-ammonia lyase)
MMIVFSNTEEHLARERDPHDPRATLSKLPSTQMKTNRLTEVLRDDTMEVVITNVGGGIGSKALLNFVKAVRRRIQT